MKLRVKTVLKLQSFRLIVFTMLFLFSGCGAYNSLPPTWDKNLPGIYEGASSSFREIVEFKPDGTFHHKVILADSSLVDESGKWSTSSGRFVVELDQFTQFYDPLAKKFSEKGKKFASYEFRPLPDGQTFNKISASVEFDFVLTRKGRTP